MFMKQINKLYRSNPVILRRNFYNIKCIQHKHLIPKLNKPALYYFHTSSNNHKTFVENENNYVYSIINYKIPDPTITLADREVTTEEQFNNLLNQEWRASNVTDIVNTFKNVKNFCLNHNIDVSDTRFDKLVDGLMDHCEKLTDSELLDLLQTLAEYPLTPTFKSHNFHDIWSCLDDISCWKIYNWDTDTRLKFARLFYKLNLGKLSDYIYETIDRLSKNAEKLSKDQMVQVFFLMNVCRRQSVNFFYEHALEKVIHEMDIDEIAVVALGYFKTETKIKLTPILNTMIERVKENSSTVHEITLTAILKCLRFCNPTRLSNEINEMLDKLLPEMDRLSVFCCLHMALIATGLQSFHKDIFQKGSEIILKHLSDTNTVRVKDIERLLNVLTMFDYDPKTTPDIFEECFKEIHSTRRELEYTKYPRCLISALNYLCMKELYSYEFMNKVLDKDFIVDVFGKSAKLLPRELLVLNASIDIECPDYKGNRLTSEYKYKGVKWQTIFAPDQMTKRLSLYQQVLADVIEAVREIIKDEKLIVIDHVLPHFPAPDIILCRNKKTREYIEPPGFQNYVLGDVKFPHKDDNLEWISIVTVGPTHTIRNTDIPLGIIKMKEKHLRKVGYSPRLASWYPMQKLTPQEKVQYISSIIL